MRAHKRTALICGMLSFMSLCISIYLFYTYDSNEINFWINVCLAIFGSAFLASLTAIVSYFHEKRETLESFLYHSEKLLCKLKKYQHDFSVEEKIKFFLEYDDMDKSLWDSAFGNIDFLFDMFGKKRWIYNKIYQPLNQFSQAVSERERHFRLYRNETESNMIVMEIFIKELETYLLEYKELKITVIEKKLVRDVLGALYGEYFGIMYGRSAVKDIEVKKVNLVDENDNVKD